MRAVALGVLGVLVAAALGHAQPAGDLERAKDLYRSAEAAMRDARYADAIRDYGAAYEITKDATFFYKIGSANERAGRCDVALIYYRRYLKEGKPNEEFVKLTTAKIKACGGEPEPPAPVGPTAEPPPKPAADPPKPAAEPPKPAADPAKPAALPPTAGPEPAAGRSDAVPPSPKLGSHKGPWLLIGGSIAFVTMGAVLAYSADAAERDVEDLYVGLNGVPPVYSDATRKRYDEAVAEGRRYETLSIASFAVAGAMAGGAVVWYLLDRGGGERTPAVTPAVGGGRASVSATFRF